MLGGRRIGGFFLPHLPQLLTDKMMVSCVVSACCKASEIHGNAVVVKL